jgi:glycosyltransferase involved in cell wall biosynthesis
MNSIALIHLYPLKYSETFIKAHKELIDFDVKYFYKNQGLWNIEGIGHIVPQTKYYQYRIFDKITNNSEFSLIKIFKYSFKKYNISAALVEFGYTAAELLPVFKSTGLPFIVHFHGLDASMHKIIDEYGDRYIEVFRIAKFVIAVSNVMKTTLIKLGCPSSKIVVNRCAPDDRFLSINPSFREPIFIGIGRFVDKKAPYYTILAFKEVISHYPNAKLVIAGDGPLWDSCRNLVRYYNLENKVLFPGVVSRDQYIEYLQTGLCFVQHSITASNGDMEGTPVSLLEASAAGLPVISTRHAGIPDVILHKKTGFLVEEHDIEGMTKYMRLLLSDKNFAKYLGENAKNRVKNFFSMNHHIGILNRLLNDISS